MSPIELKMLHMPCCGPALNLPEASESRATKSIKIFVTATPQSEFVCLQRANADEAHLAAQDVYQLWKLVKTCTANRSSNTSDSPIIRRELEIILFIRGTQLRVGRDLQMCSINHRPELDHFK